MFDPGLLERYDSETQAAIKESIAILADSGILAAQVDLDLARIVDGMLDEDPDQLAKRILTHRAEAQGLLLVHNYGLQLLKEINNESES